MTHMATAATAVSGPKVLAQIMKSSQARPVPGCSHDKLQDAILYMSQGSGFRSTCICLFFCSSINPASAYT